MQEVGEVRGGVGLFFEQGFTKGDILLFKLLAGPPSGAECGFQAQTAGG
jgi:hypothetical protein